MMPMPPTSSELLAMPVSTTMTMLIILFISSSHSLAPVSYTHLVPTGQELSANITRGAFAKMLVSFSTYRESVGCLLYTSTCV